MVVLLRRTAYRIGLLKTHRLPVPVIIAGNINVGGTGKTPLVIWLVQLLQNAGYRPGVIVRGYGGRAPVWPCLATVDSDPKIVGDEAVLIAGRCMIPVAVGPDRVAAARLLLECGNCDLIISDDGLQHYRLGRDIEIAVIDGERRFGNGHLLPAGPLRELPRRLEQVDFIVANGKAGPGEIHMGLECKAVHRLQAGNIVRPLAAFKGKQVHAVAAIGYPQRFFNLLNQAGLILQEHPFPDHYFFRPGDLDFADGKTVLMTEKDAVKYRSPPGPDYWYVSVETHVDEIFGSQLLERLAKL